MLLMRWTIIIARDIKNVTHHQIFSSHVCTENLILSFLCTPLITRMGYFECDIVRLRGKTELNFIVPFEFLIKQDFMQNFIKKL